MFERGFIEIPIKSYSIEVAGLVSVRESTWLSECHQNVALIRRPLLLFSKEVIYRFTFNNFILQMSSF